MQIISLQQSQDPNHSTFRYECTPFHTAIKLHCINYEKYQNIIAYAVTTRLRTSICLESKNQFQAILLNFEPTTTSNQKNVPTLKVLFEILSCLVSL